MTDFCYALGDMCLQLLWSSLQTCWSPDAVWQLFAGQLDFCRNTNCIAGSSNKALVPLSANLASSRNKLCSVSRSELVLMNRNLQRLRTGSAGVSCRTASASVGLFFDPSPSMTAHLYASHRSYRQYHEPAFARGTGEALRDHT